MNDFERLTNEEIKSKIDEIDNKRSSLGYEIEGLKRELENRKKEIKMQERNHFTDKCFIIDNYSENTKKYIKAFKVLEIDKNNDYAKCLVLIDGHRQNCWEEKSISKTTLGLWSANTDHLMYHYGEPKMIDMYKETTHENFNKMLNEYKAEMV